MPEVTPQYAVDPQSDLVSATELRVWRGNPTTRKVMRYLERWRAAVIAQLADGASLFPTAEASAMKTTEYVAKSQLMHDILTIEARDIAGFYGLDEPKDDGPKRKPTT